MERIVDASDDAATREIDAVREVLTQIEANEIPSVVVYNKCDLLDEDEKRVLQATHPDAVLISAQERRGLRGLLYRIAKEASSDDVTMTVLIPYDKGLLMRMVHERCQVMRERYEQGGLLATVKASRRMSSTLEPYRHDDEAQ